MTRLLVPFSTPDVSAFTKTLKSFLDERHASGKAPPSHVELLASMSATVRKALIQFDDTGRLVRLPNKLSVQQMTMWALWTKFAANRKYTEREVNAIVLWLKNLTLTLHGLTYSGNLKSRTVSRRRKTHFKNRLGYLVIFNV